jgi:septation ring formation regulator EzrA
VSPTIFHDGKYRFFFFSREENKMHVHIHCSEGEAKFWLEPIPSLVESYGLSSKQLNKLQKLVEEHQHEIKSSWKKHFGR